MKITIYHEIHPEHFEIMSFLLRVDHQRASPDRIGRNFFHFRVDFLVEIILPAILFIQILLEFLVADFVALLVLAILG